jgi:hypothetical protein
MRVRILEDITDEVRRYIVGEDVDLPEAKAQRFIAARFAIELGAATEPEATTTAAPKEQAVVPPARKR